ncbi:MAG TPA: translocation/assembly module TamB domain-containing protein, partial [Kofleriaceae bacterium]
SASAVVCGDIAIDNARIALPDRASARLLDATPPDDLVFVSPRAVATAVPRRSGEPAPARAPTHPWLVASVTLGATPVVAEDVSEGVTFHASVRSDRLAVSLGDTLGVRGTIDVDHADADVLGRRYIVEPGALIFDGSSDPRLDLRLSHEFPELALAVALAGRASKPDLRLSSEPGGYTYDQLFGFLLGGEPGGDPGNQTRDAVAGAGARLITGRVGRQINRVLPFKLDAVSCGPETKATTAIGGSCTFSKWLSERLLVAYRQHFGGAPEENVGDFQVQYRLGRKTLIDGAGRDRANFGADLLWRHRW